MKFDKTLIAALITSFAALVGAYFGFKGHETKSESAVVGHVYKRLTVLEDKYTNAQKENIELRIKLAEKHDSFDILKNYLDSLPYPAWIKVMVGTEDAPSFIMWHINPAYEDMFGISKERYVGKTDDQLGLWPDHVVKEFYNNDLETVVIRDAIKTVEAFPTDLNRPIESMVEGEVIKLSFDFQGSVAVAGLFLY